MESLDRPVIFLTGSPLPSSLDWSKAALSSDILPSFTDGTFLDGGRPLLRTKTACWRSLPLEAKHLPSGLTQSTYPDINYPQCEDNDDTLFLTTSELSHISSQESHSSTFQGRSDEDILSQYYEHSFAIHEGAQPESTEDESFETASEGSTRASFFESPIQEHAPECQRVRSLLSKSLLSDLKQMPNATYLRTISPQTKTVNLVVGIISVAQPRAIRTRRSQQMVELVEVIVGDETRAGFAVNIWLSPERVLHQKKGPENDDLRAQTLNIRPRDIVLVRNVALGSFRGSVHGQSLRKGVTTLDLLYRNTVDATDPRGAFRMRDIEGAVGVDPNIAKLRNVKDWVTNFVGRSRRLKAETAAFSPLPLDTQ